MQSIIKLGVIEQDDLAETTFSAHFCVNTGEKSVERISTRPAAISLVLSQTHCAECISI